VISNTDLSIRIPQSTICNLFGCQGGLEPTTWYSNQLNYELRVDYLTDVII